MAARRVQSNPTSVQANGTKRCSRCGLEHPTCEFYGDKRSSDGLHCWCKACHKKSTAAYRKKNREKLRVASREYRKTVPAEQHRRHMRTYYRRHKDAIRERTQRWRDSNREKRRAHNLVDHALRRGELKRPTECERCGATGRIEATHHDYDKPLDVEWLCVPCHRAKDAARIADRLEREDVSEIAARALNPEEVPSD